MKSKLSVTLIMVVLASLVLSACAAPVASPTAAPAATKAAATVVVPTPEKTEVAVTEAATQASSSTAIKLPEVDPSMLTGDITSAGSSTVYPLSEAVAALFQQEGFPGQVNIASVGTGGGFERFCKTGEVDIANASRAIKDTETQNCAALTPARTPIAFRVGTDAIAIVVSKQNTFLTNVTIEELGKIFTSAEKWSDVNPAWPNESIQRFTPGTDSGTFDFFVETIIQKPAKIATLDDAKKLALEAKKLQTSEDDNVLVQGVEGSPYAIGYFGFAYYKAQEDRLSAVSLEGVAPSFDPAESGQYKLSRPLFIYSDAAILKAKPQVAAFINFYLTRVDELINEVGYFPASEEALNASKQAWLDATK